MSSEFSEDKWTVTESGCWEWNRTIDRGGYGIFHTLGKRIKAHRFALMTADGIEDPGPKMLACHTCDNRSCVNPKHLFWGTHAENTADMVAKGRASKVGRRPKLTDADKIAIREAYEPWKTSMAFLAKRFGVTKQTINRVVNQTSGSTS